MKIHLSPAPLEQGKFKMLSGLKFIPREQVIENSDANSTRMNSAGSRRRKRYKKNKPIRSNSQEDIIVRRMKSSRRKGHHSNSSSFSPLSGSGSESPDPKELEHHKAKPEKKNTVRENHHSEASMIKETNKQSKVMNNLSESTVVDATRGQLDFFCKWEDHLVAPREHHKSKEKENDFLGDDNGLVEKHTLRKDVGLEWMLNPLHKPNSANQDVMELGKDSKVNKSNTKELNPYLNDNGGGYPDAIFQGGASCIPPTALIGDGGASWRLKALRRAREQALREGHHLKQITEDRWGSLYHLGLPVAPHKAAPSHAHLYAIKDRKRALTENSIASQDEMNRIGVYQGHVHDDSIPCGMKEPRIPDSLSWKTDALENRNASTEAVASCNKYANGGSFMAESQIRQYNTVDNSIDSSHTMLGHITKDVSSANTLISSVSTSKLSENQLAAKVLQLQMKGKHGEAEQLLKEAETGVVNQCGNGKGDGQQVAHGIRNIRAPSIRKDENEDNADRQLANKIVQNRQYSLSGQADDEYDYDDLPSRKKKDRSATITLNPSDQSGMPMRLIRQQERCLFCFENLSGPKHLIISVAYFTYLMLPLWQPVVEGHCCILPKEHESATRSVNIDIWDEIRNFKKCLIRMFSKLDRDVIFLETVMGLSKQKRHCLIECIPLPREIARQGPLYFKKAIDEAEEEWSQHSAKKLIDTSEKGLRGSIPPNFPYFHVEFGLNKGFVHVIDDEKIFTSNLGLNVIRGMLHLPEEDMYRRRKQEPLEVQRRRVAKFLSQWDPFDWTKQL